MSSKALDSLTSAKKREVVETCGKGNVKEEAKHCYNSTIAEYNL